MKHLFKKLEEIKEKIKVLASNVELLRSENQELQEENQKLRSKLHQDAAEIRLLKSQLTNYKAKIDDIVFGVNKEQ